MDTNKTVAKPIRIAYIIGKMWAGGVEAVVFNYYRAINHSEFQFDFYYDSDSTVEPPQDIIDMGARFIILPPYQHLLKYIRTLRKYLKKERYTIVHSHLNTISVFPLYVAWSERVPVRIAHNHSVPSGNELGRNIAKSILRRFSKLFSTDYFACSEKAGRWMFGDADFDVGRVYVLRNAVDFDKFRMTDSEIERRKRALGLEGRFVVGHIGRFTYAKNHQFLLDVFKVIAEKNEKALLLLVGDGELRDDIIKGIEERKIKDNVVLVGKVHDPERYYRLCDVIILPSVFEGLSMTTIESQIAGVPAVISEAIPREAVISDACVYKSLSESAEEWAEAAITIAGKDVKLTDATENYNIRLQAPKLEKWYYSALDRVKQKTSGRS